MDRPDTVVFPITLPFLWGGILIHLYPFQGIEKVVKRCVPCLRLEVYPKLAESDKAFFSELDSEALDQSICPHQMSEFFNALYM